MLEPEDTAAMSPHRKIFTSLCIASSLALAAQPALSEDDERMTDQEEAMALAQEGARKLVQAIELMIQAIPQYAPPEVLENGDIVIRRLNPEDGDRMDDDDPLDPTAGEDVEGSDI
jgi:hypothetical protein